MIESWKKVAKALKRQTLALYFAYRDPRVPWFAKAWILLVIAYAFSPIDLIPDFIPVLGYLDDLVIIPFGVWVAVRMIPSEVMLESRSRAETHEGKPVFRQMAWIVVLIWLVVIVWLVWTVWVRVSGDNF